MRGAFLRAGRQALAARASPAAAVRQLATEAHSPSSGSSLVRLDQAGALSCPDLAGPGQEQGF